MPAAVGRIDPIQQVGQYLYVQKYSTLNAEQYAKPYAAQQSVQRVIPGRPSPKDSSDAPWRCCAGIKSPRC